MRTEIIQTPGILRQGETASRGYPSPGLRSENASDREVAAVRAAALAEQRARSDAAAIEAARAEANGAMAGTGSELAFELDDGSGRMVFKLVDKRTRDVLRQVPSEEMLAVARALKESPAAGALLRTDA